MKTQTLLEILEELFGSMQWGEVVEMKDFYSDGVYDETYGYNYVDESLIPSVIDKYLWDQKKIKALEVFGGKSTELHLLKHTGTAIEKTSVDLRSNFKKYKGINYVTGDVIKGEAYEQQDLIFVSDTNGSVGCACHTIEDLRSHAKWVYDSLKTGGVHLTSPQNTQNVSDSNDMSIEVFKMPPIGLFFRMFHVSSIDTLHALHKVQFVFSWSNNQFLKTYVSPVEVLKMWDFAVFKEVYESVGFKYSTNFGRNLVFTK